MCLCNRKSQMRPCWLWKRHLDLCPVKLAREAVASRKELGGIADHHATLLAAPHLLHRACTEYLVIKWKLMLPSHG